MNLARGLTAGWSKATSVPDQSCDNDDSIHGRDGGDGGSDEGRDSNGDSVQGHDEGHDDGGDSG